MKKILLIEDDTFLVDIYVTKLEENDFKVDAARTGEEGIEMMKKNSFDLVLLDISLPGMDGWDVLEKIRENGGMKKVKVLILSNMDDGNRKRLEDLDAEKYLMKINHTPDEVVQEIKKIFG